MSLMACVECESEPLVVAIMLTERRLAMAERAVRAFWEQTYANKQLLVIDSGAIPSAFIDSPCVHRLHHLRDDLSIGELRNFACRSGSEPLQPAEIFIHWDDDDVSHPTRIAEQVAHLQSSGADVVGYNELLFAREVYRGLYEQRLPEAWLWKNAIGHAGSSFCYWRTTWEKKPFPDLPKPDRGSGEDFQWVQGLKYEARSGAGVLDEDGAVLVEPALLCSIHGGNVTPYSEIIVKSDNWRRVPEWDAYCCERMKL